MDIRQRLRRDRDRHDGHHPAIFMREDVAVHYEDTLEIHEPGSHREVSVDDDGIAVGIIESGSCPRRGDREGIPPDALRRSGLVTWFPRALVDRVEGTLPDNRFGGVGDVEKTYLITGLLLPGGVIT
jgi:hypothetical protein